MACMEQAGEKDWRMWESKLKMLGVNPSTKAEVTVNSPAKAVLDALELMEGKGDGQTTEDTESASSSTT
jgi:hypothetical protein